MQTMVSGCLDCLRFCCGCCFPTNDENDHLFAAGSYTQPVKTVRRISSVGQTLTTEDGEEIEMPRHSSVLQSYNGVAIPWSHSPISIQPGVSKSELENRLKTLPTISELPQPKKPKRQATWKLPIPSLRKKEYSLTKHKPVQSPTDIPLKRYMKNTERNNEEFFQKKGSSLGHNQISLEDRKLTNLRRGSCSSSPNLVTLVQSSDKNSATNSSADTFSRVSLRSNLAKSSTWLHSQSLEDVKSREVEAERLARQYGLDLALYKNLETNDSPDGSLIDSDGVYSMFNEQSSGFVEFSLYVNDSQNLVSIFVSKVGCLSGVGHDKIAYSVLLKVCAISNKNMTKSSKKMAISLNPVINQSFTFFTKSKDKSRTLRVSVYNAEFLGRFDAVGHALVSPQDFQCNRTFRAQLYRKTQADISSGMLQISCHIKDDRFYINVVKVLNLVPKYRNHKLYVKISYHSLSRKAKERVSAVVNNAGSEKIEFQHQANFTVDTSGLKHNYFVVSLKKRDSNAVFKHDETIGRVFIGPCFYAADGKLTPWGHVLMNRDKLTYRYHMYL